MCLLAGARATQGRAAVEEGLAAVMWFRAVRTLAGCCGLVLCVGASLLAASPAGAVAGYGDVADDNYYADPVQWSVDNNITADGPCFSPDAAVSRGETAVWVYNMENQPDPGERHSFSDVTDASQHDAVSWMVNEGITTGTSDETFSPDDTLRRAQAAAFLHRLAGEPSAPAHGFVDVVADWQQDPVSWMANTGITTGTTATTFAPEDTLTRAQLITFLYRYQDEPAVTVDPATPHCDPTPDTPQHRFESVSAGYDHSCGVRDDGTAVCWGNNDRGQADAPGGVFGSVSAGGGHSCGVREDGTAVCWGNRLAGRHSRVRA